MRKEIISNNTKDQNRILDFVSNTLVLLKGASNGQIWKCSQTLAFAQIASKKRWVLANACAGKFFATARMLGFSLKLRAVYRKHNLHLGNKNWHTNNVSWIGNWETLGKHAHNMNISKWRMTIAYLYFTSWIFLEKCFLILLTVIEPDCLEFKKIIKRYIKSWHWLKYCVGRFGNCCCLLQQKIKMQISNGVLMVHDVC